MLLWYVLLGILGQLHHLRIRLLHIVAIGAVHQCGAHCKQHRLILRLWEDTEHRTIHTIDVSTSTQYISDCVCKWWYKL